MAKGGQCFFEKLRRCVRTVFFVVALVASLAVTSLPVVVAVVDVLVPCFLISNFTCVKCFSFKEHFHRYAFNSSLMDIPLVSVIRSLIILCTRHSNLWNVNINYYIVILLFFMALIVLNHLVCIVLIQLLLVLLI